MKLVLGTRGSLLAKTQSQIVTDALQQANSGLVIEFKEIKTRGDKKQGTPEASKGDKKDWIYELEQEVLAETIDIAVHSGKDVPSDYEDGTEIMSVLAREDARDVFIGKKQGNGERISFADVPCGASIGTASLRRQASLRRVRPDLVPVEHRGNVPTRLKKLDDSTSLSGIVLAKAGIQRLGVQDCIFEEFDPGMMMPAVNQGILCIQFKTQRSEIRSIISTICEDETQARFTAERACVSLLGADCKSSISVFAECGPNKSLFLSARVLSTDGTQCVEIIRRAGTFTDASKLGETVGNELLAMGAAQIIEGCRASVMR